ncbi:hypothetical protein, partial [Streptomyces boncukensis]
MAELRRPGERPGDHGAGPGTGPLSELVARLRAAGWDPSAEELAEAVWLACRTGGTVRQGGAQDAPGLPGTGPPGPAPPPVPPESPDSEAPPYA